jgi:ATP-dependent protease ClpP protease subunit
MAEISIYGEIVPFKWWEGGFEYDLSDLNKSLEALASIAEGEELIVNIHSPGGCTITGFSIYNKLRRFKNEKKINLTTRIDGYCCSIGVTIFLAGDKRIGNAFAEPFVHNAWTWTWEDMDKKKATKIAEDLTRTDNTIATQYEQRTNITKDQALALMDADTWLTPEQCMEYGFYTELEDALVPVDKEVFNSWRAARSSNNLNNNTEIMANKKQGLFAALQTAANKFLGTETVNKIVFTAANEELDFYELGEDDTPAVGDKATFGGNPAGDSNDGTYVMATGETYKFTGEELTEIIPASTDSEDLATENAALKAENEANLKKDLKTSKDLLAQFAAIQAEDEEDTEEEPETPGRVNKKGGKSEDVPTRNLFANIK